MNDVKKKLLEEIDKRIARRKEAKARAIQRNTIEAFVLNFIKNVEDINNMTSNEMEWEFTVKSALSSMTQQVRSYDDRANIEVSWYTEDGKRPVVNGVTVKWSKYHQQLNNCDPELFVDVTTLLFN